MEWRINETICIRAVDLFTLCNLAFETGTWKMKWFIIGGALHTHMHKHLYSFRFLTTHVLMTSDIVHWGGMENIRIPSCIENEIKIKYDAVFWLVISGIVIVSSTDDINQHICNMESTRRRRRNILIHIHCLFMKSPWSNKSLKFVRRSTLKVKENAQ